MREIKFRGKRIDNGEWVYGYIQFNADKSSAWVCESKEDDWTVKKQFPVDPKTVGEYTGLLDKNDKDIYEGDTWLEGESTGIIVYEEACFKIKWTHNIDFWSDSLQYHAKHGAVIGNIYENKELLP